MPGDVSEKPGIKVSKFPLTALGRAVGLDEAEGFVKIASDANGTVVGIEIVSDEANAMIAEAALAIEMGANLEDIADTIHPHPTYSEAIQEAAELSLGRSIHFFTGQAKEMIRWTSRGLSRDLPAPTTKGYSTSTKGHLEPRWYSCTG